MNWTCVSSLKANIKLISDFLLIYLLINSELNYLLNIWNDRHKCTWCYKGHYGDKQKGLLGCHLVVGTKLICMT